MKNDMLRFGLVLGAVCLCSVLALSLTYIGVRGRIEENMMKRTKEAVRVSLSGGDAKVIEEMNSEKRKIESKEVEIEIDGKKTKYKYYIGYDLDNKVVGYAGSGLQQGYQSRINVMVGMDKNFKKILGVKVVSQQETPGLGANVDAVETEETIWSAIGNLFSSEKEEKKDKGVSIAKFQKQFFGVEIPKKKTEIKKKIDEKVEAITGATITSNATKKAVMNAIEKLRKAVAGGSE